MRGRVRKVKVRALTPFSLGGGVDVEVGQVFELDEDKALEKIRLRWVEAVDKRDLEDDDDRRDDESKKDHPQGGRGNRERVATRDPQTQTQT